MLYTDVISYASFGEVSTGEACKSRTIIQTRGDVSETDEPVSEQSERASGYIVRCESKVSEVRFSLISAI